MDQLEEKGGSISSLGTHLSAFRSQRDEGKKDLVSVLALALQETMVRGAIDSCRKNGVPENEILAILGDDTNLAVEGTRMEGVVTLRSGAAEINRTT